MDNFVVSARKYRPQAFDEVVGQDHITTTLTNAIKNNHLAQALLFCGPRGVGKTTCARIVARTINEFDASQGNVSLNIFELDAASNNSVDHIRNLTDQIRYPPQHGKFKVYIIDEVHMLSNQAFNAFLKTLEEPPPYAIFILATTEKNKVIPTILSRCQIYDFNRISITDIVNKIKVIAEKEKVKYEDQALHLIAQKADGALRDALSLFDLIVTFSSDRKITYQATIDNLHILDYDYYFQMADHLFDEDISQGLLLFDEILKKGFDGHDFTVGLGMHLRNLLVCQDLTTINLLEEAENVKTKYKDQAERLSQSFIMTAINYTNHTDLQYKDSKNQRLLVELMLMKIAHIPAALQLTEESGETDSKPAEAKGNKKKAKAQAQADKAIESSPDPSSDLAKAAEPEKKYGDGDGEEDNPEKPATAGENGKTSKDRPLNVPENSNLRKTVKLPTLADLGTPSSPSKTDEADESGKVVEEVEKRNESFTSEDLETAWTAFKEKREKEGKAQEINVLSQPIMLDHEEESKQKILVTLTNSIQLDILSEIKSELLLFMKDALKNDHISVEGNLQKEKSEQKIYTSGEKFEYLAKKNPLVKDLQQRLGLDPDF